MLKIFSPSLNWSELYTKLYPLVLAKILLADICDSFPLMTLIQFINNFCWFYLQSVSRNWSVLTTFTAPVLEEDPATARITAVASRLASLLLPCLLTVCLFSILLEGEVGHITVLQPSIDFLKNPDKKRESLESPPRCYSTLRSHFTLQQPHCLFAVSQKWQPCSSLRNLAHTVLSVWKALSLGICMARPLISFRALLGCHYFGEGFFSQLVKIVSLPTPGTFLVF